MSVHGGDRAGTSSILYRGRTLVAPVIGRGPYTTGVTWDLTQATGQALGIPGTAHIAAIPVPPAAAATSVHARR